MLKPNQLAYFPFREPSRMIFFILFDEKWEAIFCGYSEKN